jgi:pseudouridine synthase
MLVLFNKPYGVLSQFTSDGGRWKTLAEFIDVPNVYAAGRLDADSEGLLLLTDNGALQSMITNDPQNPQHAHGSTSSPRTEVRGERAFTPVLDTGSPRTEARGGRAFTAMLDTGSPRAGKTSRVPYAGVTKTYWAQVEGVATDEHAAHLMRGVRLNDGPARAVNCKHLGNIAEPWPRDPPIRARKSVPDSWIDLTLDEGRNRQVRRMTAAVGLPTLRLIRVAIGPWRVDDLPLGGYRTISDVEAFSQLRQNTTPKN